MIEVKTTSNLIKVFKDTKVLEEFLSFSILKNETFSYQVCVRSDEDMSLSFKVNSKLNDKITVRQVLDIHAKKLNFVPEDDDYYLFDKTNERDFPDLLKPISNKIKLTKGEWITLYITVKGVDISGVYPIDIVFSNNKIELGLSRFELTVINKEIDLSKILPNTIWFHYDAIANYYHLKPFSKRYYKAMNNFMSSELCHGVNVIYVPLFTPPLDTAEGLYRRTVQLVDVSLVDNKYIFNFDRVFEFIDNAKKMGFTIFEMSHLFSQWGAKYAPKVMVRVNGKLVRYFGWKDDSLGDKYFPFIKQFLKEFVNELKVRGFNKEEILFHISDEPGENSIDTYKAISNMYKTIIKPYRIFDALSSYKFYEDGVLDEPVVSLNHVEGYRDHNVNTYVYYCCTQSREYVPNKFLNIPLNRQRMIGATMYKDNAKGLLNWGFNFYNSQLSLKKINPFETPDSDGRFPAGDPFYVYPGENYQPLDSLRWESYFDGLQDYALLKMVEDIKGKDYVMNLLTKLGINSYKDYPHRDDACLELHNALINELDG